jgi:hypothetical protein
VRRPTPDLTGLAVLRALVVRERLALAGSGGCAGPIGRRTDTSAGASMRSAGHLSMAVGTKTPAAPRRGGGGSSYSSPDPEQERTAALVTLAQQGDGEAFGLIYDKYVDSV